MATLKANGIDIYFEQHGEQNAEPVLLIMGFAMNAGAWGAQIDALKERYRVIAFDNRGAGRSSQPAEAYTIPMMAEDAIAVLDSLGIASAHIVSASMGGMIAQELTLRHPERVRTLTLMCTMCGGPHAPGFDVISERSKELDEITDLEASITPERAMEFALELFTPEFLKEPGPGLMQMAGTTAMFPSTLDGIKGQNAAILGHNTYDRLPQITAPTLVLAGEDDPMIPAANSRILAERIPNARLRVWPGLRHGFNAERPDEVNAELLAFLDAHAGTSAATNAAAAKA